MLMEQKQLDEMDESFFAEEYLDEESLEEIFDDLDAKEATMDTSKKNPFSSVDLGDKKKEVLAAKTKDTKEKKALKVVSSRSELKPEPKATLKTDAKIEKNTFPSASLRAEAKVEPKIAKEEIVITPVKTTTPLRPEVKTVKK